MLRVKLNLPNCGRKQVVQFEGVGYLVNGRTNDIPDSARKALKPYLELDGVELVSEEEEDKAEESKDAAKDENKKG